MPGASLFHDLVRRLRWAPAERFGACAVDVLSEPVDWLALVRGRLEEMTNQAVVAGTASIFVPGVEPKTFLLHNEPGRFRIVLNHFDRDSFECHQSEGRISPHFHHFDFATRMLRGYYHHVLFNNAGDVGAPRLSMWHHTKDAADHVYFLPWDQFHCVLAPDDGTMSLQIRGPVRYTPRGERPLPVAVELLDARDAALEALDLGADGDPTHGRVPDYALRWLPDASDREAVP